MTPLFITTYNHPEMLERFMHSGILHLARSAGFTIFISDQSTGPYVNAYKAIADKQKLEYVHWTNEGASAAKRTVIRHAATLGSEFFAQVSEDFIVKDGRDGVVDWLPSGKGAFLGDSLVILKERTHLAYVNWSFARGIESAAWCHQLKARSQMTLHKTKEGSLLHMEGDTVVYGWPYTGRTSAMNEILDRVMNSSRKDEAFKGPDGGEWLLASKSLRMGGVVIAEPLFHDRKPKDRPRGSLP